MLSDGVNLLVVSERFSGAQKRWLVTAFEAGPKASGKDRALLIEAKEKISQATVRSVDGERVTGQTHISTDGQKSTDRLAERPISPSVPRIKDAAPDSGEDASFDLIDMIMDPDGIAGSLDNPGAMTPRDAAKVAARDEFMVERFMGCIQ
jgi:hypothetical protein